MPAKKFLYVSAAILSLTLAYCLGASRAVADLGAGQIAAVEGLSAAITTDGRIYANQVVDDRFPPKWTYAGRMTGLSARPVSITATQQRGNYSVFHVICADGRHFRLAVGKDYRSLGPVLPDTTQVLADILAEAQSRMDKK